MNPRAKQLSYSDTVSPVLSAATVQAALDAIKAYLKVVPTSPFTSNNTLSQHKSQVAPLDSVGGTFTQTLPSSPSVGDEVFLEDWGNNIATTNITISGGSNHVQDFHSGVLTATSYAFGSNEISGSTQGLRWVSDSNTTPTTYWKVI